GVEDPHGAERGLERLREAQPDLRGLAVHLAAYRRHGTVEKRVRQRSCREGKRGEQRDGADAEPHDQSPNIGLPMLFGKRSSMKKWIWNNTPVLPPVALFMGMIASSPSCMYRPAHSSPGLMVPGVGPLPSSGFCMDTSTSGISRLNGSPRP